MVRQMSETNVDVGAVIGGIFLPGTISERVAEAYDDVLFGGKTLQDLPDDSAGNAPRFVINATNIQSAVLWRFSRHYMGDYRVGLVRNPNVPLCKVVAASSAFPPILSPMSLGIEQPVEAPGADLNRTPYTKTAVLSDGGVYDNLGLETVKRFTTLLVSDAGQKIAPENDPHTDWARHSIRIFDTVDNQVRSLRKRHLINNTNGATIPGHTGVFGRTGRTTNSVTIRSGAGTAIPSRSRKFPPDCRRCHRRNTTSYVGELGVCSLRCGSPRAYRRSTADEIGCDDYSSYQVSLCWGLLTGVCIVLEMKQILTRMAHRQQQQEPAAETQSTPEFGMSGRPVRALPPPPSTLASAFSDYSMRRELRMCPR